MHPAVKERLQWFQTGHLGKNQALIVKAFGDLATMVAGFGESPQVTLCLTKLLEAKDCAVRASISTGVELAVK